MFLFRSNLWVTSYAPPVAIDMSPATHSLNDHVNTVIHKPGYEGKKDKTGSPSNTHCPHGIVRSQKKLIRTTRLHRDKVPLLNQWQHLNRFATRFSSDLFPAVPKLNALFSARSS